jgi:hypothetical protein
VFVSRDYIEQIWAPLFAVVSVTSAVHDHQASVVLEVA